MRFVCDQCKSKYSISDDKVRGKILKIRCKRCDNVIEVRDPVAAASSRPAAPGRLAGREVPSEMPGEHTQVSSPGLLDELRRTAASLAHRPATQPQLSEWFVAIGDAPVGPLSREQVRSHVAAGRATSESLVWREGFEDWRPLREASELADLLRGSRGMAPVAAPPRPRQATPPPPPPEARAAVVPLRPVRSDPSGIRIPSGTGRPGRPTLEKFAADPGVSPPPPAAAVRGGRVAVPLRGRDVGRLGARPLATAAAVATPAPQAAPVSGARLAAALPAEEASPSPAAEALASPALAPEPPSLADLVSAPPPPRQVDEDLPFALGALPDAPPPPTPYSSITPSLVPEIHAVTADKRRTAVLLLVLGAVIVGVVGAGVLVKVLGGQPEAVAADMPGGGEGESAGADVTPTGENPVDRGALAALIGQPSSEDGDGGAGVDPGGEATRPVKGGAVARPGSDGRAAPGGGKTLSDEERRLLEQAKALGTASGPVTSKGGSDSTGGGDSPARRGEPLSSDQVRAAVGQNMSSIQQCYEREMRGSSIQHDLRVLVYMRIGTSGTVRTAQVRTGTVRGTALGNCIEGAVRRWRFPNATGETEVETPFVLTPRR